MTRVLIIDDDDSFVEILTEFLEEDGLIKVIDRCGSEKETSEWLKLGKLDTIDAIVLDLRLPFDKGDKRTDSRIGLRILNLLRDTHRFFGPIIVLTNSRDSADGKEALGNGCDGYLCKHAPADQVPVMVSELKMALLGDVVIVSSEMRHVFFRDDVSAKEARLMDLLSQDRSWSEIAQALNYKSSKAAANVGDRIFDKILTEEDRKRILDNGVKKKDLALEVWRARHRS
ncbi:MAG: response regulator [Candidatus Melainabacteria bacterium]|nr:response regulator [Candidatus Melainabacteria bacterium]